MTDTADIGELVKRNAELANEITGLRNSYWEERKARLALEARYAELEKDMEEWCATKDVEISASFDAGHYRAMSEHATPWKVRAEKAEAELANLRDRIEHEPVVKALEWSKDWSGSNEDIPVWRGKNPIGLYVSVDFAGRLFDGRQIERHDEIPADELTAAKAAAQADYERRIRSALANPEAEARLRERVAEAERERDEATNWSEIVDRHGIDQFDSMAEAWLELPAIKRVTNAVTSTFEKWADDDMMRRFREHQMSMFHMSYVEGCLAGVKAAEARLAQAERQEADRDRIEREPVVKALRKIADESLFNEPFKNENRILSRDDMISLARSALASAPERVEAEPIRWMGEETSPGGSIRWWVVQHEHMAREIASKCTVPCKLTPLYGSPSTPVVTDDMEVLRAIRAALLPHWPHANIDGARAALEAALASREANR